MSLVVVCDICRRPCQDYSTIANTGMDIAVLDRSPLHVCHARDGGDVGCIGHVRVGIRYAQDKAQEWLREHRPI